MKRVIGVLMLLSACAAPAQGQQGNETGATDAIPAFRPMPGYLAGAAPDPLVFLPAPPAMESTQGRGELQIFHDTRALEGGARWAMAAHDVHGDNASMMQGFACALGAQIDVEAAPMTLALIRKALADVSPMIGSQKAHYAKPRPFDVAEGATCVNVDNLRGSGAYPSGHSAVGWTWALALAQLAPDRAGQIVARGRAFGESRVVCGVHWPSDVEGGQLATLTVMTALQAQPDYRADREIARAELDALRASSPAPTDADCAAEQALTARQPW